MTPTTAPFGAQETKMATLTAAARQRAYRARKAAQALAEVRGIFAAPADHGRIKAYAARLARQAARQRVAERSGDPT